MLRLVFHDGDELRICGNCGDDFVFAAGERRFYEARGLKRPSRCPACRQAARLAADEKPHTLGRCAGADCGRSVCVPFTVTTERPLYCIACIQQRRKMAA